MHINKQLLALAMGFAMEEAKRVRKEEEAETAKADGAAGVGNESGGGPDESAEATCGPSSN